MQIARLKVREGDPYAEDIIRIQAALLRKEVLCSPEVAREAWLRYSDSLAASWLSLPSSDEEIYYCVSLYLAVDPA